MTRAVRSPSYAQRFDRVLDHITDRLEDDLSLAALARVAGFSPFHFHRLFQAHTGETVHGHVRRIRVERAASLMRAAPRRALTAIALEVGFASLSDLSRAFKQRFGIAPSRWDRTTALPASAHLTGTSHGRMDAAELARRARGLAVRTRELPRSLFVYTRIFDPYGNQRLVDAYHHTRRWLDDVGLAPRAAIFAGMSIDDPAVVPAKQCRYDLGLLFPFAATGVVAEIERVRGSRVQTSPPAPRDIEAAGLSVRRFPAIEVATVRITGDLGAVDVGWQWLYRTYLPGQRRVPANQPAMELFLRIPEEIGWEQFDIVGCVPLI